jgi:hypothetical protein
LKSKYIILKIEKNNKNNPIFKLIFKNYEKYFYDKLKKNINIEINKN